MNHITDTFVVGRTEAGAVTCTVVVTREANGCAVWFDPITGPAGLLEWHAFGPRRNSDGVYAAAKISARRMANEAIDHGVDFVCYRKFVQK